MVLVNSASNYIEIPHSPELNPTDTLTLEGWVKLDTVNSFCASLIGKNYTEAFWAGDCGFLRTYIRGNASSNDGGTIPIDVWTHWAVTVDSSVKRHYINGELVEEFEQAGPLTTSTAALRIGSDVSWPVSPDGSLSEFRLWNVARTQEQIQSTMNLAITEPMPGLVAVWSLNVDGSDALGNHDGTVVGAPVFAVPEEE
jgi:hypothetical protein